MAPKNKEKRKKKKKEGGTRKFKSLEWGAERSSKKFKDTIEPHQKQAPENAEDAKKKNPPQIPR